MLFNLIEGKEQLIKQITNKDSQAESITKKIKFSTANKTVFNG